jgi:hypothetical protein
MGGSKLPHSIEAAAQSTASAPSGFWLLFFCLLSSIFPIDTFKQMF